MRGAAHQDTAAAGMVTQTRGQVDRRAHQQGIGRGCRVWPRAVGQAGVDADLHPQGLAGRFVLDGQRGTDGALGIVFMNAVETEEGQHIAARHAVDDAAERRAGRGRRGQEPFCTRDQRVQVVVLAFRRPEARGQDGHRRAARPRPAALAERLRGRATASLPHGHLPGRRWGRAVPARIACSNRRVAGSGWTSSSCARSRTQTGTG